MKTPQQLKQWVRSNTSKRIDTQSDWQKALHAHIENMYKRSDVYCIGIDLDGEIEHLRDLCKSGDLTKSQCDNLIKIVSTRGLSGLAVENLLRDEFMRDSPSKRGFDRLYRMLVFCDSIKEVEQIERIIGRSVMTRAISIPHAKGLVQIAEQRKRQLKELRTIKGWRRNANDQERFAASLIAGIVGTFAGGTALACLILFVIR